MDLPRLIKGDKIRLLISGEATQVLRVSGTIKHGNADFMALTDATCTYINADKAGELWIRKSSIIVIEFVGRKSAVK